MSHVRGAMLHAPPAVSSTENSAAADDPPPPPAERLIRANDLVVVVEGFNALCAARVTPGGKYTSKFGAFAHDDWIGTAFGTRVRERDGRGFVWLCAPTPELWTKVLEHRTQILYAPDISLVCMEMGLAPGSVVLESGTGSGSLTHALARCVAPTGKVWTFEFNETRMKAAREEFELNGVADIVTVTHRDIERDGFPSELAGTADAVFLDLPGPHKCVASAARSLRPDGVLCAFSPCIEQVHKTIVELKKQGFGDIKTVELLGRYYDVEGRRLQRDLSTSLSKDTKSGWRKNAKRPREGEAEETDGSVTETVVAFPRQRLQSHTAYLTFARLVPAPENWTETLAARATKSSTDSGVLERAAEFLQKRREARRAKASQRESAPRKEPREPGKNIFLNPDEYSD